MADFSQLLQLHSPPLDNSDAVTQQLFDSDFSFSSLSQESPVSNPLDSVNWNDILQASLSPPSDLATPNLSPFNSPPSAVEPMFQLHPPPLPPQQISFTGNPLTSNLQQVQLQLLQQNLLLLQQQRQNKAVASTLPTTQPQISDTSLQSLIASVIALNNQKALETGSSTTTKKTKSKSRNSESEGDDEQVSKTTKRRKNMTAEEKEEKQRERILRNRAAAQESRDKKRRYMEDLEAKNRELTRQNMELAQRLAVMESFVAKQTGDLPITPPLNADGNSSYSKSGAGSPGLFNFTLGQIGDSAAVDLGTRASIKTKTSVPKAPTTLFSGDHLIMPASSPQRMLSTSSWSPETLSSQNSYILNAPNRSPITLQSIQPKSLVSNVKISTQKRGTHSTVSTPITPSSMDQQMTLSTGSSILVQSSQHPLTAIIATGLIQSMIYWVLNSRRLTSQRQSVYNPWMPSYLLPKWMAGSNISTFKGSFRTPTGETRQYQGLLFSNRFAIDGPSSFSNGSKIGLKSSLQSYYSVGSSARLKAFPALKNQNT